MEEKKQANSDYTNTTDEEDFKAGINGDIEHHNDVTEHITEVKDLDKNETQSVSSYDSSSESENEEVEYKAETRAFEHVIPEELEESVEDLKEVEPFEESQISEDHTVTLTVTELHEKTEVISQEITVSVESKEEVEEECDVFKGAQNKINGDVSHIDVDPSSQIICCSEVNWSNRMDVSNYIYPFCYSGCYHCPLFKSFFLKEDLGSTLKKAN